MHAHQQLETYLHDNGLSKARLPDPETKMSALYYKDVRLDEQGLNTIDHLVLRYSLIDLLMNRRFDDVIMNGVYIDIDPEALLYQSRVLSSETLPALPFQSLSVKNATFATYMDNVGALSFTGEMNVQKQENKIWVAQASFETKQHTMSAYIKAQGSIHQKGYAFDLDFERGKFLFDDLDFKMSRITGEGKLINDLGATPNFSVNLQAGGANFQETPWQNVAMTIEKKGDEIKVLSTAKSIGVEGLEAQFDSTYDLKTLALRHKGSIFTPHSINLYRYLRIEPLKLPTTTNLTVHIAQNKQDEVFYGLTNGAQTIRVQKRFDGRFNLWAILEEALQTLIVEEMNAP